MSDLSLEQASSPPSSPHSVNFPITRSRDDLTRVTSLPAFNNVPEPKNSDSVAEDTDHVKFSGDNQTRPTAPAAHESTLVVNITNAATTTTTLAKSQMGNSPDFLIDCEPMTHDSILSYTSAITQTEASTPETDPIPERPDDQDGAKYGTLSNKGSQTAVQNHDYVPETGSSTHDSNAIQSWNIPGGPSRVVATKHDREDCCPALLITKEVIWRMEGISEEDSNVNRLKAKVDNLEQKVEWGVHCVKYNEGLIEEAESPEEINRLREVIAKLQDTLAPRQERLGVLKDQLATSRRKLANLEGLFHDTLVEVLNGTGLLKPRDNQLDSEDADDEDPPGSPLEGYSDDGESIQTANTDISLEELNRRTVHEEVKTRHIELLEAEHEFDRRHQNYELTKLRYLQVVRAGECEMTMTEFDHCGLEATREFTRNLRRAEDAFEEALACRKKLGPNDEDQGSGFVDDDDDGYDGYPLSSFENDLGPAAAAAPTALIHKWLENTPDINDFPDIIADLEKDVSRHFGQAQHESGEGCDDIRSAGMSDGWSCRDWSRNRKRIDRWRAVAERER
ncbi:MAG: hypothetical protein Q9186_002127 [Xanthomendoza sp. 1 TL-2023]